MQPAERAVDVGEGCAARGVERRASAGEGQGNCERLYAQAELAGADAATGTGVLGVWRDV